LSLKQIKMAVGQFQDFNFQANATLGVSNYANCVEVIEDRRNCLAVQTIQQRGEIIDRESPQASQT